MRAVSAKPNDLTPIKPSFGLSGDAPAKHRMPPSMCRNAFTELQLTNLRWGRRAGYSAIWF